MEMVLKRRKYEISFRRGSISEAVVKDMEGLRGVAVNEDKRME